MNIDRDHKVGQIAAEEPLATRVFARHGIDYCCGGGLPLHEACEQKGIDADAVLGEIRTEVERSEAPEERWDQAPLSDLVTHILAVYHRPLHEELPQLETMARKVADVHRDKAPEMLSELLAVYLRLKAELEEHMAKEEQILFPMIQQGQGSMADGPISVMQGEHEDAAKALGRLRSLTNDYTVPEEACNTWRALWHRLAALEESLHRHIHLENNILFPRALAS
jgi:regulator of cell morphogenesis and NO signaling